VAPATVEDAAGLLRSAIRDDNPVLYLESKYLYRRIKVPGPLSLEPVPIGKARIAREGDRVTVVTYSASVHQALEAAAVLAEEGISVEVVDVRSLVPLDMDTIAKSVEKTARAVVLHEAPRRLGYGAEIAAEIGERCFWSLDQPVVRIGAKNTPIPTSPPLEDAMLPSTAHVIDTVRKVATS
jgi:acetoin:2,6-dichlorophenolindophenol oxidoreductase subunit beta